MSRQSPNWVRRSCPCNISNTVHRETQLSRSTKSKHTSNHIDTFKLEDTPPSTAKMLLRIALLAATTAQAVTASSLNETYLEKRTTTLTPVMGGQNFPDPSLLRVGNDYYAYATNGHVSGQTIHIQLARSLGSFDAWTFLGTKDGLPTLPNWVDPTNPRVWAPDVVRLKDGSYVMYYTAALKSNPKLHCLGVATSATVLGPFKPTDMTTPWICPTAQGGAIDPAGYEDPDGTRWVVYKVDGNSIGHGGSCNNGVKPIVSTPIMLQQVNDADGHTKIGVPAGPLIANGPADGPVTEAPSLSRMTDGTYVLFFSSNCYATPKYDVSYATAKHIKGPYTKYGPMVSFLFPPFPLFLLLIPPPKKTKSRLTSFFTVRNRHNGPYSARRPRHRSQWCESGLSRQLRDRASNVHGVDRREWE